jgi:hypothetical protein
MRRLPAHCGDTEGSKVCRRWQSRSSSAANCKGVWEIFSPKLDSMLTPSLVDGVRGKTPFSLANKIQAGFFTLSKLMCLGANYFEPEFVAEVG